VTRIAWTDESWSPIKGCGPAASPGCTHCWVPGFARRNAANPKNTPEVRNAWRDVIPWDGTVRLVESQLSIPLRWKKPRMVATCLHTDLFHKNIPDEWIDRVFAVMGLCPQHTFQLLTKRPERMRDYITMPTRHNRLEHCAYDMVDTALAFEPHARCWDRGASFDWPLPNVHLGVSVENQRTADERIPLLLQTPAAVRFVSLEPMLGPVNLRDEWLSGQTGTAVRRFYDGDWGAVEREPKLSQIILGCESGPHRRPCEIKWMTDVVEQRWGTRAKAFVKQVSIGGKVSHNMDEWPEALRVQEYPKETT